jgi:hypothetical protein
MRCHTTGFAMYCAATIGSMNRDRVPNATFRLRRQAQPNRVNNLMRPCPSLDADVPHP